MLGELPDILASKSQAEISEMDKSIYCGIDELSIEREGELITRITKAGVVIWPLEGYTAGMDPNLAEHSAKANAIRTNLNPQRANDSMIGGNHYKQADAQGRCPNCGGPIEHWDWAHNLRGLEYAATKYIARWRNKGGVDSLKKAIHYCQKLIEIHRPGVTVTVSYSDSNGAEIGSCGQSDSEQFTSGPKPGMEATAGPGMAGVKSIHQEVRRYTDAEVLAFIGGLSTTIPELSRVKMTYLTKLWEEFKYFSRG